jgi:hypothetical protein
MKSTLFFQTYCLAGFLLFSLSLSAEPVDHSTMHHEEHGEMQHDIHQSMQGQNNDASEHMQHHDSSDHMQHDASEHHPGDSEHHENASEHHDHAGMMMHEKTEHSMQEKHENMQQGNTHHAASNGMTMESAVLPKLKTMPPSGKSREAGYDNRYVMESTSAEDSVATQCAQASRGLVMVDNATWTKCGGKPQGWSKGINDVANTGASMDHSGHMGN